MLLCVLAFAHPKNAAAVNASRQVKPFLTSLESTPYDFHFIREGLLSVHSVKFEKGVVNQYQPFLNRIILSMTMNDGIGRIKPWSSLGSGDFGTLAHEAFHAYKANFVDSNPQFLAQKRFLERRAQNLYLSIPAEKRDVTLEEAYASWIGWMIQSQTSMISMIERLHEEGCEQSIERLPMMWEMSWNATAQGYWYKDSFGEYWIEQFKAIRTLLTEGMDAYRRAKDSDGAHYVEEDLQPLDRQWIAKNFFKNRISEDFRETFKNELRQSVCASHFNLDDIQ